MMAIVSLVPWLILILALCGIIGVLYGLYEDGW